MKELKSLGMRVSKLERAFVFRDIKLAGSGLDSVQALVPGISDRKAKHFLHALAGEILEGRELKRKDKNIRGDITLDETPQMHHGHMNSPYVRESEINGVVGLESEVLIEVEISELEKTAKISLMDRASLDRGLVKSFELCDALSKNIMGNILRNMEDAELDEIMGEPRYEIESNLGAYVIVGLEILEYEYRVISIAYHNDTFRVLINTSCEYSIVVEREPTDGRHASKVKSMKSAASKHKFFKTLENQMDGDLGVLEELAHKYKNHPHLSENKEVKKLFDDAREMLRGLSSEEVLSAYKDYLVRYNKIQSMLNEVRSRCLFNG